MQITDFVTQISNKEDVPFLRIPLFDVNMRLFKSSPGYRHIVLECCSYIRALACTKLEGYTLPYGMSGANVGIPFNIICVIFGRGAVTPSAEIFINPHITEHSKGSHITRTNCGSIRLPEPIKVRRANWAIVTYFDERGEKHEGELYNNPTVQHEIEHNKGILITDLEVKE